MCFGAPKIDVPEMPPPPPAPPPPPVQQPAAKPMNVEVGASKAVTKGDEGATLQQKEADAALKAKKKKGTATLRKQAPTAPGSGVNVSGTMGPAGGSLNIQRQ